MYAIILAVHNVLRWIVLILAILALVRAYGGWLGKRDYAPADRKAGVLFGAALDTQLLVGLILYFFLSPITQSALQNFQGVLGSPDHRFFALDHGLFTLVAVVSAHLGTILAKRADQPVAKHRFTAIFFSLAAIAILVTIPWWRPLLPGLG